MKTIYLAGPITPKSYKWRSQVKKFFEGENVKCLDPEEFEFGIGEYKKLVRKDLQMIKKADVVFFYIDKFSTGTPMEMVYSHQMKKKMVAYFKSDSLMSPWHLYHCRACFTELETALGLIKERLTK